MFVIVFEFQLGACRGRDVQQVAVDVAPQIQEILSVLNANQSPLFRASAATSIREEVAPATAVFHLPSRKRPRDSGFREIPRARPIISIERIPIRITPIGALVVDWSSVSQENIHPCEW